MAWDSTRPVPWTRLMREWVIYAAIMAVIFVLFFRDDGVIGALVGVLLSGPLYLFLGAVLAKFGYRRKGFRELRAERDTGARSADRGDRSSEPPAGTSRPRPAPTKRTSTGPGARPKSGRKRRR